MDIAAIAMCLAASQPSLADGDVPILASMPTLPATASSASGFAPVGWMVEQSAEGDLDRDGRPDLVAVLKGADAKCIVRTARTAEALDINPRLLLVAFGRASGYGRHLVNARIISRLNSSDMGDPLEAGGLSIGHGTIGLQLSNWRAASGWATDGRTLTFR